MGDVTKIQWCDKTFNCWRGCSRVSAGCKNCYAAREAVRFPINRGVWGDNGTRVLAAPSMWQQPIKWNRDAEKAGIRARVFCASLADVFEAWDTPVHNHKGQIILESYLGDARDTFDGTMAEWEAEIDKQAWHALSMHTVREDLFKLIDATPWLDWLLLTKRPENIRKFWKPRDVGTQVADFGMDNSMYRHNAWLGTSVAEQADAEKNIPELLKCRDLSPVLFVSAEPLIGPVDFTRLCDKNGWSCTDALIGTKTSEHRIVLPHAKIDWVIAGGESGRGARPFCTIWANSIVRQCREAGVACFVKQIGSNPYAVDLKYGTFGIVPDYDVSSLRFRDSKGGDPSEWAADLRVRQFPEVTSV